MHILLLEPDYQFGQIYRQSLELAGHTVDWSQTAQRAIHAADKSSPDMVVMELQIAGHNGVEFLYEFKSYIDWQTTPVIIHSMVLPDVAGISSAQRSQLSIVDYLYKPLTTLAMLNKKLETYEVTCST